MNPQSIIARGRWQRLTAALTLGLTLWATLIPTALAVVDDAHSAAMAMSSAVVGKGFRVREEYWKGEAKTGQSKQIKAQLFKGNEYWFWAGLDADEGVSVTISITDAKGQIVHAETTKGAQAAAARVVPAKTGSYAVTITIKGSSPDPVPWAIAYGYK
jgi:hypothetical protein